MCTKKNILCIIAFSLALSINAIAQNKNYDSYFSSKDSTTIAGKVIGYTPGDGDDFINFKTHNLAGDETKHAIQLSNDGSFSFSFYWPHGGDIVVNYKNAFENVHTEPSKKINLTIFNNKLDTDNNNAFTANGQLADINNLNFDFQSEFLRHQFRSTADLGDKEQPDSVFAKKRSEQLNEELAFLNKYVADKHITNGPFKKFQFDKLSYAAGADILLFPFFGKLNKTITENQLLKFIAKFPVDNAGALDNAAYLAFLKKLILDEQIIINISPAYDAVRQANGYNSIPLYLSKINKLATGIVRQVMYYDLYNSLFKHDDANKVIASFDSTITNPYIKKQHNIDVEAAAGGFKLYDVVTRIKELKVSDSLKQKFIALFEKQKGTNLYLDFWGDWCVPCMMEMPGYPKLITAFNGKPLKFIFLSVNMTEQAVLTVKNKYQINADFINLSKDETAVMNNVFEFHSYPHHIIINKAGKVVNNEYKSESAINKLLFP